MAEWLLRGTVNTFIRGSIPLNALNYNYIIKFNSEHVEIW